MIHGRDDVPGIHYFCFQKTCNFGFFFCMMSAQWHGYISSVLHCPLSTWQAKNERRCQKSWEIFCFLGRLFEIMCSQGMMQSRCEYDLDKFPVPGTHASVLESKRNRDFRMTTITEKRRNWHWQNENKKKSSCAGGTKCKIASDGTFCCFGCFSPHAYEKLKSTTCGICNCVMQIGFELLSELAVAEQLTWQIYLFIWSWTLVTTPSGFCLECMKPFPLGQHLVCDTSLWQWQSFNERENQTQRFLMWSTVLLVWKLQVLNSSKESDNFRNQKKKRKPLLYCEN